MFQRPPALTLLGGTTRVTGHVFIATSLDGFIARPDGGIDWLEKFEDTEDYGYGAFMARMDGLIMGRGTYEKVLGFGGWPYTKPVVVMSRSLGPEDVRADLKGRVTIESASPRALGAALAAQGWRHAYVDGGKLVQSFLRDGLIADITLTRIPVLLGEGRPLFGALDRDLDLEHVETRSFDPPGFVQSVYRVCAP